MHFERYDVLTVGLQCIDIVVSPVRRGILDRDSTTVDSANLMLGGDALNQAIVLSQLGAKVGLMGLVGNDHLGDVLLDQLKAYPIDVLNRREDVNTSISLVLVEQNGDRHFIYQPKSNLAFRYDHIDENAVRRTDFLSVGGCPSLPALCGDSMLRILDLAQRSNARIALDFYINESLPDRAMLREILCRADYILPSELEASAITGEAESPVRMVEGLRDLGAKNIIVKLGEKGCYVAADGFEGMIDAYPCKCIDTTGAGDTFVASFLYAKTRGWDIERCARFACAAGSIAVEHAGANAAIQSVGQVLDRMG